LEAILMRGDVIGDEIRRVRDELVKRYRGLDGWIEHLQAMDRERARQVKRQGAKYQPPLEENGSADLIK
jgi:hypothetical protein